MQDKFKAIYKRTCSIIGWPLGAILIIACISYALIAGNFSLLYTHSNPFHWCVLLFLLSLNLMLTGLLFWRVYRPFEQADRPIRPIAMIWVIAATTLANYLPIPKAGLISRAIYLKQAHRITYSATAGVFLIVMLMTVTINLALLGFALLWGFTRQIQREEPALLFLLPGALILLLIFSGLFGPWYARKQKVAVKDGFKEVGLWVGLRLGEISIRIARLWICFNMLGHSPTLYQLIAIAAASSIIARSGITPNGVGINEWLGGLIASSNMLHDTSISLADGATAMLIDQAMNILFYIPLGLFGFYYCKQQLANESNNPPKR